MRGVPGGARGGPARFEAGTPARIAEMKRVIYGDLARYPFVTLAWARQWPSEEVWKVRKRS